MHAAAMLTVLALCTLTAWAPEPGPLGGEPERVVFGEIWAYLMRGEEDELAGTEPITDLCYFSAGLNRQGRITETIARPTVTLKDGLKPAVHLVVADLSNYALMHFALDPKYGVRPLLLEDICRVAEAFDGVQIDFESVWRDDADCFIDGAMELPQGDYLLHGPRGALFAALRFFHDSGWRQVRVMVEVVQGRETDIDAHHDLPPVNVEPGPE